MAFAADDLRQVIENQWSLGGFLSKTGTNTMREVVKFYSRPQIQGTEVTKAVEVQKDADAENEDVMEHPRFTEVTDIYKITVRYRAVDIQEASYNDALSNIQAMQNEVIRIIKTQFNPRSSVGVFSTSIRTWDIMDNYNTAQPELIRVMTLRLTAILSEEAQVFRGFGGVLIFDVGGQYVYTEAYNVRYTEGWAHERILTNDRSNGIGVPKLERGMFSGQFTADMYAKREDFEGSGDEKLPNIYKPENSTFQNPLVIFKHANQNTEPTPKTLTTTTVVKVTRIEKSADTENLVSYRVIGDIMVPTVYAVT